MELATRRLTAGIGKWSLQRNGCIVDRDARRRTLPPAKRLVQADRNRASAMTYEIAGIRDSMLSSCIAPAAGAPCAREAQQPVLEAVPAEGGSAAYA